MIVVDPSAVVAIMIGEPDADALAAALDAAPAAFISAGSVVELGLVLEGRAVARAAGTGERYLREARVEIVPVDQQHAERALEGWRRFGKGRHPAGLNFGDCFTYALAATLGHPVLCTGRDFAATDLAVVPLRG